MDKHETAKISIKGLEILQDRFGNDTCAWEKWAEEHGCRVNLDEYRCGDGTGDDELPDSDELLIPTDYGATDYDGIIGREVMAGPISGGIRIAATNCGACGSNFASIVWDIDIAELEALVESKQEDGDPDTEGDEDEESC